MRAQLLLVSIRSGIGRIGRVIIGSGIIGSGIGALLLALVVAVIARSARHGYDGAQFGAQRFG